MLRHETQRTLDAILTTWVTAVRQDRPETLTDRKEPVYAGRSVPELLPALLTANQTDGVRDTLLLAACTTIPRDRLRQTILTPPPFLGRMLLSAMRDGTYSLDHLPSADSILRQLAARQPERNRVPLLAMRGFLSWISGNNARALALAAESNSIAPNWLATRIQYDITLGEQPRSILRERSLDRRGRRAPGL